MDRVKATPEWAAMTKAHYAMVEHQLIYGRDLSIENPIGMLFNKERSE